MKAKVKELYSSIKHLERLSQTINEFALDYEGNDEEYWDEAGQAAENVEEAIDILCELLEG